MKQKETNGTHTANGLTMCTCRIYTDERSERAHINYVAKNRRVLPEPETGLAGTREQIAMDIRFSSMQLLKKTRYFRWKRSIALHAITIIFNLAVLLTPSLDIYIYIYIRNLYS